MFANWLPIKSDTKVKFVLLLVFSYIIFLGNELLSAMPRKEFNLCFIEVIQ